MTIIVRSLEGYSTDVWANLPWRLFESRLVRLQRRIHKASKTKNIDLVKKLQRLLIGSNSARYLAVRYIIENNLVFKECRQTNFRNLTSKQKIKLVTELKYPRILSYQVADPLDTSKNVEDYIACLKIFSLQSLFRYATEPVIGLSSLRYFYKGQFVNSSHYLKIRSKSFSSYSLASTASCFVNKRRPEFNFQYFLSRLNFLLKSNQLLIRNCCFSALYSFLFFQKKLIDFPINKKYLEILLQMDTSFTNKSLIEATIRTKFHDWYFKTLFISTRVV
jgi:hypothetical protein